MPGREGRPGPAPGPGWQGESCSHRRKDRVKAGGSPGPFRTLGRAKGRVSRAGGAVPGLVQAGQHLPPQGVYRRQGGESPSPSPPGGLGRRTPCPRSWPAGRRSAPRSPAGCGRAGGGPWAVTVWPSASRAVRVTGSPSCPRAERVTGTGRCSPGCKTVWLGRRGRQGPGSPPAGCRTWPGPSGPKKYPWVKPWREKAASSWAISFRVGSRCSRRAAA